MDRGRVDRAPKCRPGVSVCFFRLPSAWGKPRSRNSNYYQLDEPARAFDFAIGKTRKSGELAAPLEKAAGNLEARRTNFLRLWAGRIGREHLTGSYGLRIHACPRRTRPAWRTCRRVFSRGSTDSKQPAAAKPNRRDTHWSFNSAGSRRPLCPCFHHHVAYV
jgi:hypothetical protein